MRLMKELDESISMILSDVKISQKLLADILLDTSVQMEIYRSADYRRLSEESFKKKYEECE